MTGGPRLFEVTLRIVPEGWRESVRRDLLEESAEREGRPKGSVWLVWHALRVGLRFRFRELRKGWTTEGWIGRGFRTDARLALRSLLRRPWPALGVVAILGLGIGGVTATYAVFNHVVFRPVPGIDEPDRLVSLYYQVDTSTPGRTGATFSHLVAMRDESEALEGLANWSQGEAGFGIDATEAPQIVSFVVVTKGYFDLLGVRWRSGRGFSVDEYAEGRAVLVVSEAFVREHLGEDVDPVGRTVYLNGHLHEIVGVTADFRGTDLWRPTDLWVPHLDHLAVGEAPPAREPPGIFQMVGRLRDGATLEQAQEQVLVASRSAGPVVRQSGTYEPTLFAGLTDGIDYTKDQLTRMYRVLMAGVAMLLILACANAANLVLARNVRRRADLAMRTALGAARGRLIRELTVESGLLAAAAGALSLAVASGLTHLFRGTRLLSYLPALDDVALDGRVLIFCAGGAAVALFLSGVMPAVLTSRMDLRKDLGDARGATTRMGWPRTSLVTAQLALSMTLLVGAGLLARTVWGLQSLDLGLETDGVVSFELRPYNVRPDAAQTEATLREARERLAASPGVQAAAVSFDGPFGSYAFLRIGEERELEVMHYVSSEYFEVFGIPLLAGRIFEDLEEEPGSPTRLAVVSESFARKWFGTTDAVGRVVSAQEFDPEITLQVIGVVGDVRTRELREGFVPAVYLPAAGHLRRAAVLVRSDLALNSVRELARSVVHEVDPLLPIGPLRSVDDDLAVLLAEERLLAKVGVVIAVLSALLAVAGLHAVVTFFVSERVREFAIRMTLGASGPKVATQVLRRVAGFVAVGIPLGVFGNFVGSRWLAGRLYGVQAADPLTLGTAAGVLVAAALLAAWIPTHRAMTMDPMASLRLE